MVNKINPKVYKVFNALYNYFTNNGYDAEMESDDSGRMTINIKKNDRTAIVCVYTIVSDEFVYVSTTTIDSSNSKEFKLVITIDTIRNKILVYYNDKAYVLDYSDNHIATLVQDIVEGRK